MFKPKNCPKCGSEKVLEIFYGLPVDDMTKPGSHEGIMFGGCIVSDEDPAWHCKKCDWEWGGNSKGLYNKEED